MVESRWGLMQKQYAQSATRHILVTVWKELENASIMERVDTSENTAQNLRKQKNEEWTNIVE